MRSNGYTAAIAISTLFALATSLVPAFSPVRPFLSPLLVAILPGLAVSRLIVRDDNRKAVLAVLGCGLSLAISVIAGLLLNLAGSMSALAWASTLSGVTLFACALRFLMKSTPPSVAPVLIRGGAARGLGHAVLFSVAAVVAVAGIYLARQGALAQREYSFTEFWMTPRQPVDQNIVSIGIHNEEKTPTEYRVVMIADDAMIGSWPHVDLDPGGTWTTQISLNEQLHHSQRVEAWLYRTDRPDEVYRKVWLASSVH